MEPVPVKAIKWKDELFELDEIVAVFIRPNLDHETKRTLAINGISYSAIGRICEICDNDFCLDIGRQYHSKCVNIPYNAIIKIQRGETC